MDSKFSVIDCFISMNVNSFSACGTVCFFRATSNTIRTGQFNLNMTMSIKIHQNTTRARIYRNHSVPPQLEISIICSVNFERLCFTGKEPCIHCVYWQSQVTQKSVNFFLHVLFQMRPK